MSDLPWMLTSTGALKGVLGSSGQGGNLTAVPFQFAVTGEDHIRLRAWYIDYAHTLPTPECVQLSFRHLTESSGIQLTVRTMTPTNDRIKNEFVVPLSRGFVQDLTVSFQQTPTFSGLCYVTVELVRGLPPGATVIAGQLVGGYIRPGCSLAWPSSPIVSSTEGRGFTRVVEGTVFPFGVNFAFFQPLFTRWQARACFAVLATSGAAGNRQAFFRIDSDAGKRLVNIPVGLAIPPVAGYQLTWATGLTTQGDPTNGVASAPLPDTLITPGNSTYGSTTGGLDALDQYNQFRLTVEEWLEANL